MAFEVYSRILRSALLLTGSALILAISGKATTIIGGDTSVALNTTTVSALTGLGFSIAPISPATLIGVTATFPITGGDTSTGIIDHSGGLAFTKSGVTADIEDFVINLTTDKLTGSLIAGATMATNVPFFDIGMGDALTLDPTLAATLSSAYGIPNLSGAAIGIATVSPTLAPEPATLSMAGVAILAAALAGGKNGRKKLQLAK